MTDPPGAETLHNVDRNATPPGLRSPLMRPVDQLLAPFRMVAHDARLSSALLIAATLLAFSWANSSLSSTYEALWLRPVSVTLGGPSLTLSLRGWINDGLMTLFFLVVGLEIERELLVGTLRSVRAAALPIAAAMGGMIVPACLYLMFTAGTPEAAGWGVPMATDIAFALGLLGLLAPGIPTSVRAFLAALAIVDDLGAILVIALVYGAPPAWQALMVAAACVATLGVLRWLDVRTAVAYMIVGVPLWFSLHEGGIHASLAGVMIAFAIPPRAGTDAAHLLVEAERILKSMRVRRFALETSYEDAAVQGALEELGRAYGAAQSPSLRTERLLHDWVAVVILPLFALANAGVTLTGNLGSEATAPAMLGVMVGLLIGKPVGIVGATWLAVRSGLATLPSGLTMGRVVVVGCFGAIGFTMSIFVASLAFPTPLMTGSVKVAVLAASLVAATMGAVAVRVVERR